MSVSSQVIELTRDETIDSIERILEYIVYVGANPNYPPIVMEELLKLDAGYRGLLQDIRNDTENKEELPNVHGLLGDEQIILGLAVDTGNKAT